MNTDYESHPSYGVVTISRAQASPGVPLFQSDLKHRDIIRLTINTAERKRDLNHDYVHVRDRIIDIEMSLAQWAAVISSQGIGSGTPVTLSYIQGQGRIEEPPFQPRIEESIKEVENSTAKLLEQITRAFLVLEDAIETKRGVKVIREATQTLKWALGNAKSNQSFAVKSMAEAAEKLVGNAKADIESAILEANRVTNGQASIEAPQVRQKTYTALGELPEHEDGSTNWPPFAQQNLDALEKNS
jgi:hypothetical protein